MLIRVCGVIASTSWVVIRSRTTRSIRDRPMRTWFWISSPTVRRRRLPKWSMSSASTRDRRLAGGRHRPRRRAARRGTRSWRRCRRRSASPCRIGSVEAELLVDLVAADLGQVVALGVEVAGCPAASARPRASAARPGAACGRCRAAPRPGRRCGPSPGWRASTRTRRTRSRICAVGPAERLEQHGDGLLALAVDADADRVALVDLELEPGAAARDDLGGVDVLVGGLVGAALEVDARRADELARPRRARCR